MSCDPFERRICEHSPVDVLADASLSHHLAGCARCQRVFESAKELDADLARLLVAVPLDPAFSIGVLQRIDQLGSGDLAAIRDRAKAQVMALDARMESQTRRSFARLLRGGLPDFVAAVCVAWLGFLAVSGALRESDYLPGDLQRLVSSSPLACVSVTLVGLCLGSALWALNYHARLRRGA